MSLRRTLPYHRPACSGHDPGALTAQKRVLAHACPALILAITRLKVSVLLRKPTPPLLSRHFASAPAASSYGNNLTVVQEAPQLNETIDVAIPGLSINPSHQQKLEFITGVISHEVIYNMSHWLSTHPDRDPTAPLPVVKLELRPPFLMLALRTDTCATLILASLLC